MPNKYQSVIRFRGIKVDSGQLTVFTEYEIKQFLSEISHTKFDLLYFVKEMFNRKEISARKLYSTCTVTVQGVEEIAGLVVEKIDVSA